MEKNPIEVMTLDSETGFFDGIVPTPADSESEDELQIVSENITNYGNYSKPVEISPELQEKILQSLQKSAFPGKIQSLKIVATKTKNNEKGTVRASFNSANGISHVINVGPDFKENFVKQVQGEINNNVDPLAMNLKKSIGAKRTKYVSQSRSKNPKPMRDDKPLFPIRNIKQSHFERKKSRKTLTKNLMPQIETITVNQNPLSNPSFIIANNNTVDSQQNSASSPPNVLQNSDPLLLDTNDQVTEDDSVEFSPIKFARYDDDHEGFIEKSLESNKLNRLDEGKCEEWQAQERKQTKENNDDIIYQVPQKRNKRKFVEIVPKQDLNVEEKINKIPIMVQEMDQNRKQITRNTLKELSRHENKNEEKKNDFKFNRGKGGKISNLPLNQRDLPPLWSSIFPPSPPSPPPPMWHNSTSLWQLEAHEFEGVTGLCRNEAAAEMRRQRAAPKPIARVLRQKQKKKTN